MSSAKSFGVWLLIPKLNSKNKDTSLVQQSYLVLSSLFHLVSTYDNFNYTTEIHSFVWDWLNGSKRAAVKWKVEPKVGQKNKHSRTIVHKEKATYHISLYYFDVQQGQVVSVQICERQTLCILQSKCTD